MKSPLWGLGALITLAMASACSKAPQAPAERSQPQPQAKSFESQVAALLIAPPEAVEKTLAAPERAELIRELRFEDETAQRTIREHLYQRSRDEWEAPISATSDGSTDRKSELPLLFWNFIDSVYENTATSSSFREESLATLWSLSEMDGTLLAPHARLVLAALRPSNEASWPAENLPLDHEGASTPEMDGELLNHPAYRRMRTEVASRLWQDRMLARVPRSDRLRELDALMKEPRDVRDRTIQRLSFQQPIVRSRDLRSIPGHGPLSEFGAPMNWQASISAATAPCGTKSDHYEGTGTERRGFNFLCDMNTRFLWKEYRWGKARAQASLDQLSTQDVPRFAPTGRSFRSRVFSLDFTSGASAGGEQPNIPGVNPQGKVEAEITGRATIPACPDLASCSPLVRVRVDVPRSAHETQLDLVARSSDWPEERRLEPGADVWLARHRQSIELELRLRRSGLRSLGQPDLRFEQQSVRVTLSTLDERAEELRPQLKDTGMAGVPTLLASLEQNPDTSLPGALALAVPELPAFSERSQAYLAIQAWHSVDTLSEAAAAVAVPGTNDETIRLQSELSAEYWSREVARQYLPTIIELLQSRRELLQRLPLESLSRELLRLSRGAVEFSRAHEDLVTEIEGIAESFPPIPEAAAMRTRLLELRDRSDSDLVERALIVSRLRRIHRQLLDLQQTWQDEVAQLESERSQLTAVAP